MFPKPGAKQAQRTSTCSPSSLSEVTIQLKAVMLCALQRNSSCGTLIFVMWSMSGYVAGGTEMSFADFLYLQIFFVALFGKGKPSLGLNSWFSVNEFFFFPPQTPLVTDFQWWKGNVAELLSLKKESPDEGQEAHA